MLDHLAGRPSTAWKRKQTLLIILLSIYSLFTSSKRGPRYFWVRPINRLLQRFAPWQLITSALSIAYVLRNLDRILGLDELSSQTKTSLLYSRDFNRAAWIVTALDAGFATALNIKSKWLRDICSVIATTYYLFNSDAADNKLCRLREHASLQVLRETWNKTSNPFLRLASAPFRPTLPIVRRMTFSRPSYSGYSRPITCWLFFDGDEEELHQCTELILDFPGGGFIAMDPSHHEERLRMWAKSTKRPVLSVDYGKAPEFPYPFAIEECFDLYCVLADSSGRVLGLSGESFTPILSGDSAGGNIAVNVMFKIIEASRPTHHLHGLSLPRPKAIALTYAALNFAFGSWVQPSAVASSAKLGVIGGDGAYDENQLKRIKTLTSPSSLSVDGLVIGPFEESKRALFAENIQFELGCDAPSPGINAMHDLAHASLFEQHKISKMSDSITRRSSIPRVSSTHGRITLSSKAGYIHDRILNPSMMWSMTLLYLGRNPNKGFEKDYHLTPLIAPDDLLAEFPPILLQCGARDPLVDDTLLFAERVRKAKTEAAAARAKACLAAKAAASTSTAEPAQLPTPPTEKVRGRASFSSSASDATACEGADEGNKADDVTVQIFPGWSHGYLQMMPLMHNARIAIDDIADWITASFDHDVC